jgi:hypothetical protein
LYATFLAPPNDPNTFTLIQNLSTGQWQGINPLVIALFNIMGVLPMLFISLMLFDGRGQKIPAWIFAISAFAVGFPIWHCDNPTQHLSESQQGFSNGWDHGGMESSSPYWRSRV